MFPPIRFFWEWVAVKFKKQLTSYYVRAWTCVFWFSPLEFGEIDPFFQHIWFSGAQPPTSFTLVTRWHHLKSVKTHPPPEVQPKSMRSVDQGGWMGRCFPNTMYVWHIYLHEWLIFMVNVGKYTIHWMVWVCVWLFWIRHVWVKHGKTFKLGVALDNMKLTPR